MLYAAKLRAAAQGFNALFKESLAQSQSNWQKVAMEARSSGASETYPWIDDVPGLREFVTERAAKQLNVNDFHIINKTWEDTLKVPREVIEDDRLGIVRPRIMGMGEAAAMHYDELVFGLLSQGFTGRAYDEKVFYSNHGHYNNLSDKPLSATSYAAARASILGRKNEDGRPLGLIPTLLCVSPAGEAKAREILMAERDAAGATNVWKGTAEPFVAPWLKTDTEWHLLCTGRAYKPVILQIRVAPEFQAMEKDSDSGFTRKEFQYGIYARHNVGFGLPQLAYGSTGTGAEE